MTVFLFLFLATSTLANERTSRSCFQVKELNKLTSSHIMMDDTIPHHDSLSRGSTASPGGRVIFYKIENSPECSELTDEQIEFQIDRAAEEWNKVEGANVMFRNARRYTNPDVDSYLPISFVECHHEEKGGSKDCIFPSCTTTYAHATVGTAKFIHFNTWMTWSNTDYSGTNRSPDDPLKPNLYSIALHEFGHILGLYHSMDTADAMFMAFPGDRIYKELVLSENDKAGAVEKHPIYKICRDSTPLCSKTFQPPVCERGQGYVDACPRTCGACHDCQEPVRDDYMKCTADMCSDAEMRQYCTKTCNLCDEGCVDVLENCEKKVKKRAGCSKRGMQKKCKRTCGLC